MVIDEQTRAAIESILATHSVVLFMKGTRAEPQCGFSATTAGILDTLLPDYATVNVLENPTLREGIKVYGQWPTIPQLYVKGEFIGGCDIIRDMFESGELYAALGLQAPSATSPRLNVSEEAITLIRQALAQQPGTALQLQINARWQIQLSLGIPGAGAIYADGSAIPVFMNPSTAQRADGLQIEVVDTLQGRRLRCENPNAPSPVEVV